MRHPSRYPLLHDKVQRARQDVRTLESYVAAGDVTVQPLLDEQRHNLRALEAALRDLAWLADPEAAKDVVPAFAPETGAAAVGRSLFSLRTIHDLSQEQMGERLEMSQGAVARLEGEEKQNYELATLAAYARAVDYIYLGSFVRPGRGFNDPASLSRLGVEVGHIKGMYRGREALALPRYLDLVRRRTAADVVTCYAPDPRRKLLDLVHYDGVTKERQLLGHVRSTDVVWRVLGQAPRFVVDAAADPLFHGSAFREREGVRSVCYLPFATPGGPGVIFLSYRHRVEAPSAAYWHLLKGIAPLTEFVMAGHESEAAAEGRGRPAPGVVHRPARAAAVAVVAAPVDADRGRRTGIADFIEALLIDRAAHDHRWSSKAVTGVLGRVAERLGKRDTVCFLYVLDGNHRVALRNQFPAATGDLAVAHSRAAARAAMSVETGRPVLVEDATAVETPAEPPAMIGAVPVRSVVCAPLIGGDGATVIGAIVAQSTEPGAFDQKDVKFLERVGQMLQVVLAAGGVMAQVAGGAERRARIDQLVRRLFDELRDRVTDRSQVVADLIRDLFGGAIVDIWPVDWSGGSPRFDTASGVQSKSDRYADLDPAAVAPREHTGNSVRIMLDPARRVLFIPDARADSSVNPRTVALKVGSLFGAPVYGPGAYRPDGIIWVRFRDVIRAERESLLREQLQVIAAFVHLIWNPLSYQILTDPAGP